MSRLSTIISAFFEKPLCVYRREVKPLDANAAIVLMHFGVNILAPGWLLYVGLGPCFSLQHTWSSQKPIEPENQILKKMDAEDGTVPLDETFTEIVEHCGRTYQHYSLTNGTYFAPIDEDEVSRLELMHGVLSGLFDERLIFPPIRSPKRVLDCGCGTGDWAMEVATQYPDSEVLGIDVSPHMIPENPPDNMELQVDDLNGRFTFESNHFDLVHSQMVAGGINANRWRSYVRDIFRVLKPGGWCQMVEIYFNAQSDNGTLTPDHALSQWSKQYLDSQSPYKDPRAPLQLAGWMRSAGFTEVESRLMTLPMCGWSNVPRDYEIGRSNNDNVNQLLSSLALYPFTQFLGMSFNDFQLLVAQARSEASNPAFKAYFPIYVCIGKKPRR